MSASPARSTSRSRPRSRPRSPRRRSTAASPDVRSPSPTCRFDSDDEWPPKKPEPPPRRRGCAFVHSERGCRKGNACTFSHDPADVADPRWHPCASVGCSNLCRGTYCPRCRPKPPPPPPRRERSRSPRRPRQSRRDRSRSKERSRSRSRTRTKPPKPAYCSQCGRRY
jgi:hypothetical protein